MRGLQIGIEDWWRPGELNAGVETLTSVERTDEDEVSITLKPIDDGASSTMFMSVSAAQSLLFLIRNAVEIKWEEGTVSHDG